MRIRATTVNACRSQLRRRQSLTDEKNNAEWFLDDPVLKVQNAQSGKREQTEKREKLVAPFHQPM